MERGNKVRPLVGRSLMWTANFRARAMPSRWVSASSAMIANLNMLAKIVGRAGGQGVFRYRVRRGCYCPMAVWRRAGILVGLS